MIRLRSSRQMLRQAIITSKTANAIAVANTVIIVANERTYITPYSNVRNTLFPWTEKAPAIDGRGKSAERGEKLGRVLINPPCRLYRQNRTSPDNHGMSVLCQFRSRADAAKNSSITSSSIRESRWTEFALHRDARHRAERVALIGEGSAQAFQPHRAEQRQRESPHSLQSSQQSPAGISLYALGSVLLWPEHLLALNLVVGDCLLAIVRNEPVDELLAKLLLHMRMLGRVYQYGVILVEQQFIAFHCDDEVRLVLEREPRAAVRQHIGPGGCCHVERGTHALSDRFVPRPFLLLDVDAGGMPEIDFRNMRTGPVAA